MRYLYLHGFASSPQSSKAQFFRERFAKCGIDLHVLDLAENDFENLTITRQLNVVDRAAGPGRVTLLGSSLGGYLSALYASKHPEVDRLVLLAPAFRFPTHYPEDLGPERMAEWKQTGRLPVFHYGEGRERDLGYSFYEDGIRYDAEPEFSQPALILHGTRDDVVPPEFSREYARRHPNVQLEYVDSGHQLTDVLDTLWDRTREFLKLC